MSTKVVTLLLVILLISVCFNIFFVTGYTRSRSKLNKLKTREGRVQLLSKRLNLTKSKEEQLIQLRQQLQTETDKFKEVNKPEIDAFWAEMIKDKPDTQKICAMVEDLSDKRDKLRMVKVDYLRKVLALCTPEQRSDLAEMIRERSFLKQL